MNDAVGGTAWQGAAAGATAPVRVVTTIEELERELVACDAAERVSDDALRASFRAFRMDFSRATSPDPFGAPYRDFQLALYERIAGKRYAPRNEATDIDWRAEWLRPFPFSTRSTATTANHLGAMAFLFRALELPPAARVLEFGPGWGNTTVALAQLGMRVTAVDIERRYCEAIRARAAHQGVEIDVRHDDFFFAERVHRPFDAAIFFECFHHCDDHLRLLRALRRAVRPGGRVYFGAEPILENYPVPWGLRMDPEALWAIRRQGWLELGFDEGYFREALARTGWIGTKQVSADYPWISVWTARRSDLPPRRAWWRRASA